MPRKERDWNVLVAALNELHSIVERKPKHLRLGFRFSPAGILNAYREGDLTFNQSVQQLERWAKRSAKRK